MSRYGLLQDTEQRFKEKLRNLDLDRPMARPLHYKMACERCVFGSGEHREDCVELSRLGISINPYFDIDALAWKERIYAPEAATQADA